MLFGQDRMEPVEVILIGFRLGSILTVTDIDPLGGERQLEPQGIHSPYPSSKEKSVIIRLTP